MSAVAASKPSAAAPESAAAESDAPHAKVKELMKKDLKDYPGKEALMILVDYPPCSSDPIHRHNAHARVYVLDGSIVMQLKGGKQITLLVPKPGAKSTHVFKQTVTK